MVDNVRKKRIGEAISHEIASTLVRNRHEPLFAQITITSVDVSPDLSVARVFFSIIDESKIKAAEEILKKFAGFLRKNLAHNLNLRVTPRLTFFYDDSIRRGQVISRLINDAIAADTENKTDET